MRLTLAIENHASLPDGGPLSVTVTGGRGIDIGRDEYLDWTLPDPNRFISGKHCEIRAGDGEYLLYDVSTNGTFVNDSENRVQSPYRLHSGDRLTIGQYVVAVTVDEVVPAQAAPRGIMSRPASYDELWKPDGEIAPPIPRSELKPERIDLRAPDDWIERPADLPGPIFRDPTPAHNDSDPPVAARAFDPDTDWAPVVPKPEPAPEPSPAPPAPRRILSSEGGPWSADAAPSQFVPKPKSREARAEQLPPAAAPRCPEGGSGQARNDSAPIASFSQFLAAFAAASSVPQHTFQQQTAGELGERLGSLIRLLAFEMKQLLDARSETKRLTRSVHQTMIQAQGNNPLKFSPTAEDALRIMLGPATRGYLDAPRAFTQGFSDLKYHQLRTYSAMQKAMRIIAEDLDPAAIENATANEGGLGALIGSRKARLWDSYVSRWKAKTQRRDDGLVDVFMQYFAECYDKADSNQ
ncbi:MAG: type VI secretion system-associated FHA domain protein TagH [Methylocella sp.]